MFPALKQKYQMNLGNWLYWNSEKYFEDKATRYLPLYQQILKKENVYKKMWNKIFLQKNEILDISLGNLIVLDE